MKKRAKNRKVVAYSALKLHEKELGVAWASRDLEKCIGILEKILKLNPKSSSGYFQLSRVYGLRFDYEKAVEQLDEAVRRAPRDQKALTLVEAGRAAREFYDSSIAESFLVRAVDQAQLAKGRHASDDLADARLALAEHFSRVRNYPKADELVHQVLGGIPNDNSARLVWCKLNERDVDRCVEELHDLSRATEGEFQVKVYYQLAKMLDAQGDYSGAMKALHRAKAPMMHARDEFVPSRQRVRDRLGELSRDFTSDMRSRWFRDADKYGESRNIALLGGHPRSGTTLMEQVLDCHGGIASAEESENFDIAFYSRLMRGRRPGTAIAGVLDSLGQEEIVGCRANYWSMSERCLGDTIGSRVFLDKNPSMTFFAAPFFRLFPEMKFIVMLRDPRDVVLSCFMQSFLPLNKITGSFLTLRDTAAEVAGLLNTWVRLREVLSDQLCEVRYEELVEDLEGNTGRVLDFLGLGWDDSVMNYDRRAQEKIVRSPTAEAVTEQVHTRAKNRWQNYQSHMDPVMDTLSPCLDALGYA